MQRTKGVLKKDNKQTPLIPKAFALQHILFLIYYLLFLSMLSRPVGNLSFYHKITTRMFYQYLKKRRKKTEKIKNRLTDWGGDVVLIVLLVCLCLVLGLFSLFGFLVCLFNGSVHSEMM